MSNPRITIYGYSSEREKAERAIAKQGSLAFVCVHGPGGIGKTTLLQYLHAQHENDPNCRVSDILDFDDLRLHIVQNVLSRLADRFKTAKAPFAAYYEAAGKLDALQQAKSSDLSQITRQAEQAYQAFVMDQAALAGSCRTVILFDTMEKVQGLQFWSQLLAVLAKLHNAVIFLAGREGESLAKEIEAQVAAPDSVEVIALGGLGTAALSYFKRTDLGQYLAREKPQQAERVCRLSGGRPILIDLAVDWLGQGIALPLEDAPAESAASVRQGGAQKWLERLLVERTMDLGQPRNEAILEMAHVYHYFDAERYCLLHPGCAPETAEQIIRDLKGLSFVKPQPKDGVRLHDVMRDMLNEYVWPILDPLRKRRRELSARMDRYYEGQLQKHPDTSPAGQAFRAEQLYHQLYAELRPGHRDFMRVFRDALDKRVEFAQLLLDVFLDFSGEFDDTLRAWADIHKGRLLRAQEKVEDALKLIGPGKARLQELGVREEMDTVCNVLGYCYRLLGNWDQAIAAYEEALGYSREGVADVTQIAETMNNIANVCRLIGDFDRADRYSLTSLRVRERLLQMRQKQEGVAAEALRDAKRGIANSCYVRGMVSWETGNTVEAHTYLRRARGLLTETADDASLRTIGRVDAYRAYMRFRTGDLTRALQLLESAEQVFQEYNDSAGKADVLNLRARVFIDRLATQNDPGAEFAPIEKIAQQALEEARRVRDSYKLAECHLTLCRLYARWGRYFRSKGDDAAATRCFEQAGDEDSSAEGGALARQRGYVALSSVYESAMGDIAYEKGDWKKAFDHYMTEAELASRFKEPRFARALNDLSDRLHRLATARHEPPERVAEYCDYVIEQWTRRRLTESLPQVVEECKRIKAFLGFVDRKLLEQLRHQGTDSLYRGEWGRAIDTYKQYLEARRTHTPDKEAADIMNRAAWAYRQTGQFSEARRFCQQALMIRETLFQEKQAQVDRLAGAVDSEAANALATAGADLASSLMVMGTIMWTTGNTAEAARYLRLASEQCETACDAVGRGRTYRHEAFMHFRIGDYEPALMHLDEAEALLRNAHREADLADVLNLKAIVRRSRGEYDLARQAAQECLRFARQYGARYIETEAWLTLGLTEVDAGRAALGPGDVERQVLTEEALQHFEAGRAYLDKGYPLAQQHSYNLLLSVYEGGGYGDLAFLAQRYGEAFKYYAQALIHGARYEMGRVRREIDRISGRLVQLPSKYLMRSYADYLIREWEAVVEPPSLAGTPQAFELLKEYADYV